MSLPPGRLMGRMVGRKFRARFFRFAIDFYPSSYPSKRAAANVPRRTSTDAKKRFVVVSQVEVY